MKKAFLFSLILLSGCTDVNELAERELNEMKKPIRLSAERCGDFGCSVLLVDSTGKYFYIGNMATLANVIAETYNVGDTIK